MTLIVMSSHHKKYQFSRCISHHLSSPVKITIQSKSITSVIHPLPLKIQRKRSSHVSLSSTPTITRWSPQIWEYSCFRWSIKMVCWLKMHQRNSKLTINLLNQLFADIGYQVEYTGKTEYWSRIQSTNGKSSRFANKNQTKSLIPSK